MSEKKTASPLKESPATVRVCLPLAEEGESGLKPDQTETVTLNGVTTVIRRGEYVDVKVPVFEQLRLRYPNL